MYVDDFMWILFGNALCLSKLSMSIIRNCSVVSDDNDDALWC
jgi:hypothetical protein